MNSKYLAIATTVVAAAVAALAVLPYSWARIAAASLSAALAAMSPVNAGIARARARGTNASA